jgi:hypothetical protein
LSLRQASELELAPLAENVAVKPSPSLDNLPQANCIVTTSFNRQASLTKTGKINSSFHHPRRYLFGISKLC